MTVLTGVVFLGEIAARLPMLEIACNRCDRRGRLRTDRLLAVHGPNIRCRRCCGSWPRIVRRWQAKMVHFPGLSGRTSPGD